MDASSEAAEQIVRMTLEGTEVALRITGAGAKNAAAMLLAAALAPQVKAEMAALQAQLDALPEEESPQKSDSWLATRVKKLIG